MSVATYFDEMSYGPAPEADTEARTWLKRHNSTFGHFINGEFRPSAGGKTFTTYEPASGAELAKLAVGNADDVDAAIAAAEAGRGITRALSYQVEAGVRAGRLIVLLQEFASPALPVSALYPACLPSSRRSTTASRSARRAISTSRSPPGISIIMPAGRSCRKPSSPTIIRSASSARSSPGISPS